ncbi:MAG: isoprenylcysteine carboxyl methyltransferase [Bacteroidetes bacterium]|nr:isoprenylcysteine carboxyl methyltransferase [Bacteroidota bacterium]
MTFFLIIVSVVIIQRLTELVISRKNAGWLISQGAVEYGREHYIFIVLLHSLFFISMTAEFFIKDGEYNLNIINYLFLVFFIILQIARVSILVSLGRYWNTRIYRIHGSELIRTGLYRYFRHPNYIIVVCEIFTLPMIFDLYFTAVVFTILNAAMLSVRIRTENEALKI